MSALAIVQKPLAKWRSLPPKTKLAVGLGALALFLWWRSMSLRSLNILGQAFLSNGSHAPWSGVTLGNGPGLIGPEGCVLTSLTNAWNLFNPDALMTPDTANDIIKGAAGFIHDALIVATGAGALGINAPDAQHLKVSAGADVGSMRAVIDAALGAGGAALVRVFHGGNHVDGDHSVLIYGGGGGSYIAADPALARQITFDSNLVSQDGIHWGGAVPYQTVAVQALYNS